jgi:hypothetical protein
VPYFFIGAAGLAGFYVENVPAFRRVLLISYFVWAKMDFLNQRLVTRLGFLGLFPFMFLTLACWIVHPDWLGSLIHAQLSYGIAILSFLGGVHWGVALATGHAPHPEVRRSLLWGVVPTLVAWFALVNVGLGFVVQIVAFVAAYWNDKELYHRYLLPEWFVVLRLRLTTVVIVSLALTFLAANIRAIN